MPLVEVHPRTFSTRFGESPSAERTFINTPDVVGGGDRLPVIGEPHPAQFNLKVTSIDETTGHNNDPNTTQYKVRYEPAPTCETDPNPLNRCDRWSLAVSSQEKPFTAIETASGTESVTNSANEPINSVRVRSIDPRLSVKAYRADFPLATFRAVVNKTNSETWAGGATGTWLCSGGSASQHTELVGGVPVHFWEVSFEFSYRGEGWQIKVPNMGFRHKHPTENKMMRCVVKSPRGVDVASPTAQPLNSDGTLNTAALYDASQINYKTFSPYGGINYSEYFGEPA